MDYYGEDADYIHLKFGDMQKMYHFTDTFRGQHPIFCEEYEKYWNRDADGRFKDPLQIVNYVEAWGIPVHFYFNYTDTPAKNNREVQDYLIRERLPHSYGNYDNGEMTGWDGEPEIEPVKQKVTITIDGKSRAFDDIMHLIKFVHSIQLEAGVSKQDIKLAEEN